MTMKFEKTYTECMEEKSAQRVSQPVVLEAQKSSAVPKKNKSFKYIVLGIILLVLLAVVGYFLISSQVKNQAVKNKVYHVGILRVSGAFNVISDGFRAKMAEFGYVEGKDIVYDYLEVPQTATPEEALVLARKFVDAKVDLIFAFPTPPSVAAYTATKGTKIPVVVAMATMEGLDLIKSISEPGGQLTGVRYPGPEMISKRLEILIEIAPNAKKVWIGYDKNHPNTAPALEVLRPAAATLGVSLVEMPAATLGDLKADLAKRAALADPGIDAIVTMNDGFNQGPEGFAMLSKFAADHKILLAGGVFSTVQQGAIIGNSPNLINVGELSALLADKVFKGVSVGAIPVITPEQELYINYKVAQEQGLTVPEGLLNRADEIVR